MLFPGFRPDLAEPMQGLGDLSPCRPAEYQYSVEADALLKSGQLTSFFAMAATCFPWYRAPASSISLGILSPWAPAMVLIP